MVASELTLQLLFAGFAGGVLGAALGGLPAFSLAGFVIAAGELTGARLEPDETAAGITVSTDVPPILDIFGFGSLLGPHVAFAGGVAAAAYLGRRETFDTTFRYHQAKNIGRPLGSAPDVLLVGGAFGVLGVLLARLAVGASAPLDPVAFAVVVSALVHRLAFGYALIGRLRNLEHGIFDMSPHEEHIRWGESPYETSQGVAGRPVVEVWQPDHYKFQNLVALGFAVGLASGYIALLSGSAFLAFGIGAFALIFLCLGNYSVPVVYHMALPASIAALALDIGSVPVVSDAVAALLIAGLFGVVAAILGELAQRLLYAHADTHLDPPMVAILLTSLVITGLVAAGVFDASVVPYPTR